MKEPITFVKNPIHAPHDPRHFMVIKPITCEVEIFYHKTQIAKTIEALRLHEAGFDLYDPIHYIPREDVNMDLFIQSDKKTKCPLKGEAVYYHLKTDQGLIGNIAWSYEHVLDFDERLKSIESLMAFDLNHTQAVERRWEQKDSFD